MWVVPGLFNQEKLIRGEKRNSGKALIKTTTAAQESEVGWAGPLNGVRGRREQWDRPGRWLGWLAHPRGGAACRDHAQNPALAPGTSETAAGLFGFGLLVFCS